MYAEATALVNNLLTVCPLQANVSVASWDSFSASDQMMNLRRPNGDVGFPTVIKPQSEDANTTISL